MKLVARLVTRDEGPTRANNAGLILGSIVADQSFFEGGQVYEIREILGVITIHHVGPSCIAGTGKRVVDSPALTSWASSIEHVMGTAGRALFMTDAEARGLQDEDVR